MSTSHRIVVAALVSFGAIVPCMPAAGDEAKIVLAPHRAVYELSLQASQGVNGITQASGRLVFEIAGNACDGYTTNFRQVTQLSGSEASGDRSFDVRSTSFEAGDGSELRFTNDVTRGGGKVDHTEGKAQAGADALTITLQRPEKATLTGPAGTLFPNVHIRQLIQAARASDKLFSAKVYDGSDDGRKIYDTLAVVGAAVSTEAADKAEAGAKVDQLKGRPSWPVTLSYFEPGGVGERQPAYVMSFVLYDNGVSRTLKLNYGEFALKGELKSIEFLSATPCDK